MRDDLQELVDQVSVLLGAPATLEDAEFTLLAFCAHSADAVDASNGGMDAVRARSILTRGSPPETRRWFEEFGIATAKGPLRTPADPAAGILTRLMLPACHEGRTHGYFWLLDGGGIDPTDSADPRLAEAMTLAAEAGRLLAGRSAADDDLGRHLAAALTGTPAVRDRAVRTLGEALGRETAQVLVALAPSRAATGPDWRLPGAGAVATVLGSGPDAGLLAVLVPLAATGDLRPAGALAAASLATVPAGSAAGVSAVVRGMGRLRTQWEQARAAARVAAAVPRFSPVARWGELGAWRLVTELAGPDPTVVPLLADPVLAQTAEAYLDCAGSASRTAAALRVHRQTLYYRLGRIEELTGMDLGDGDARLLLHASLKSAHLSGAPRDDRVS